MAASTSFSCLTHDLQFKFYTFIIELIMKFLVFAQTQKKKRNQERILRIFLRAFKITPNLALIGLQISMEVQDTLYLYLNL